MDAVTEDYGNWEIVTPEDIVLRRKVQIQIVSEVKRVVKSILNDTTTKSESSTRDTEFLSTTTDSNDEASTVLRLESEANQSLAKPPIPSNCVLNFLFPLKTFHMLQDDNILPESVQERRVKYELDSNRLLVQVMPSAAHDVAANAWDERIGTWSRNGGAGPKTLMQCGQGQWYWGAGSEKSPDQSFMPYGITSPPQQGSFLSHESYDDMFLDAHMKQFSPLTSIRVWIGIKFTPGYGRMRAMFRLRDHVAGSGILAGSGATTDYISLSMPTNIEFIIPKTEVYFGVPPPLPPTLVSIPGPNALPPPAIPGPTDYLVLPLEDVRLDAWSLWS